MSDMQTQMVVKSTIHDATMGICASRVNYQVQDVGSRP